VEAAVFQNLLPAATERVYPGHFTINADGGGYGGDSTWPGLDSWQMIGPYLHLGRTRLACQRMKARARLVDSVRKVCRAAKGGYWRERYHLKPDGTVSPDGSQKYCEYAAVLARVVFSNREIFSP
jgi:hypothetical protein